MSQSLPYTTDFTLQRVAGSDQSYVIRGKILCPSLGWQYTIERGYEGIYDDPEVAAFELEATGPSGISADQVEELPVQHEFTEKPQLLKVGIRLKGELKTADGGDTEFLRLQ